MSLYTEHVNNCICIKDLMFKSYLINRGDKIKYHKYYQGEMTSKNKYVFNYTIENNSIILTEEEFNEHFVDEAKWRDRQINNILK